MEASHSCFYVNVENQKDTKIVRSGCRPSHEWIPQMGMEYCPFCGGRIQLVRIASPKDVPDPTPRAA